MNRNLVNSGTPTPDQAPVAAHTTTSTSRLRRLAHALVPRVPSPPQPGRRRNRVGGLVIDSRIEDKQ